MDATRRQFLKRTITATAACGLAQVSVANANTTNTTPITDTHVYIGNWPHRHLPDSDSANLIKLLRKQGVDQAWTGSFDGLFHKDIASVNQRLADACAEAAPAGFLLPFGTVNPTLPDWEEDVRRCDETFRMPGIRLHPNYHSYKLDDSRFAALLQMAATLKLVVQLVAAMDDERHALLSPTAAQVDLTPLADKLAAFPDLKLLVTNGNRNASDAAIKKLLTMRQVYFDFAPVSDAKELQSLVGTTSSKRVVFGSCAPLNHIEQTAKTFRDAALNEDDRVAVAQTNARNLTSAKQNTSGMKSSNANRSLVNTQ